MAQCDEQISLGWDTPRELGGGVNPNENRDWAHGKIVVESGATIDEYEVDYREGSGSWKSLDSMVTSTGGESTATSGLKLATEYQFRVRATNSVGLTGPWVMDTITTPADLVPNAPSSLVGAPDEEGVIELQWDAPVDQDYYNNAGDIILYDEKGVDTEDTVDDDDDANPNVPLWRSPDDQKSNNESRSLTYIVERRVAGGTWMEVARQPHKYSDDVTFGKGSDDRRTQEYRDEQAPPIVTVIQYRVSAVVNACAQSDWNSANVDATQVPPSAPQLVTAAASGNSVTLTWAAPSNAGRVGNTPATVVSYELQRRTGSTGTWADIDELIVDTTYTDMNLAYDTAYDYQVRAVNTAGAMSGYAAVSATTGADMTPTTPMGTLIAPRGVVVSTLLNSIGVTWTPGENAQQQKAVLYNEAVTRIVDIETYGASGSAHTFRNVAPGTYRVVVASFSTGDGHMLSSLSIVTVQ